MIHAAGFGGRGGMSCGGVAANTATVIDPFPFQIHVNTPINDNNCHNKQ